MKYKDKIAIISGFGLVMQISLHKKSTNQTIKYFNFMTPTAGVMLNQYMGRTAIMFFYLFLTPHAPSFSDAP
jgi:hypothetical protein